MVAKQNCWEFINCGRELNGVKVAELGICPAATDTSADGLNRGIKGGRICWAVVGTYAGKIQGKCVIEKVSCVTCDFFELVEKEEDIEFVLLKPGQTLYH